MGKRVFDDVILFTLSLTLRFESGKYTRQKGEKERRISNIHYARILQEEQNKVVEQ